MKSLLLASTLFLLPLLVLAQADAPNVNAAGVEFIEPFIETINSGSDERITGFINRYYSSEFIDMFPMEDHLGFLLDIHAQYGTLQFHSVQRNDQSLSIIVQSKRTEQWGEFLLNTSRDKPTKIAGIRLMPTSVPDREQKTLSMRKAKKELGAYVQRMVEREVFSGTILLAKGDKIIYSSAHGLASKRFRVANNLQTKFNLGSMNKMFTAVAILQLAEKDQLKLDDTLDKFADESWLAKDVSSKIQIRHLLTHTSGLGSYFNQQFMESSKNLFRSLDDYKPLIKDETLQFEPGSRFGYSNTGMFMLGIVIEKVSGQDYFSYIREHIYKPSGMVNSDSYEMDQPIPDLAIGYSQAPDSTTGWTNNLFLHVLKGGPAGGGFSTVEDLHRFALALTQYKLLSKRFTEQLYSSKPELGSHHYGYGFGIRGEPGNRIVGHGGGFPGISANLDIFLDSGYIAVVLSNYDEGARPIESKIHELLKAIQR